MRENDCIKETCVDLNHDGLGVIKVDNFPFFVNDLLPGEEAKVKIIKINKSYGIGKNIGLVKQSPNRVTPICKYFGVCGGCDLMHMTYKEQLKFKLQMANTTFKRIGHLDYEIKNIIGMDHPYNYRNKVQIPFSFRNGKVICGFYKKKSHDIVEIDSCYLQPNKATDIARFVRNLAIEFNIKAYDEVKKQGTLRHIVIRKTTNDEYMIVLVINGSKLENSNEIINKLVNKYPDVKSVILNYNNKNSNVILGEEYDVLYGTDTLIETILGLKFNLSHKAFFQVNHEQTEKLYSKVLEYLNPNKTDIVLDCYCGVGTMSLLFATKAKKVYGIEISKEAINDAQNNATLNCIDNTDFIAGKAEEEILKFSDKHIDLMVVDPPRKGLDIKVVDTIKEKKIERLVYVSCDIATLARDLKLLESDYEIKDVTLFDMFPNTADVETVALLEKKK